MDRSKHNLSRRVTPQIDKILHLTVTRLSDDLQSIMLSDSALTIPDLQKLCDIIKSLAAIQKLLPTKTKKDEVASLTDITND